MSDVTSVFRPEWRLAEGQRIDSAELRRRLDYCLEWRAGLWRTPTLSLIGNAERFAGKRVMELGARYGRMSCLLAAAGAEVVGVDIAADALEQAKAEAARWGVERRTRFSAYDGNFANLPAGPFDIVFTKSTLVMVDRVRVPELLAALRSRLRPGGVGLFVENRNTRLMNWLRRHVLHREESRETWERLSWGFFPEQMGMFRDHFGQARVAAYWRLVWAIEAGPV